jgi:hypothetical protein
MVKVCVPGYSILGQRRVSACSPLKKHPHSSLRGWSHPSLRGYSSMSLEYPKLNTWTEANLGEFLIPLLYEGLFLLYEGLFSFSFSTKVYLWDCSFLLLWSKIFPWYNTMLPICWAPSIYWITFILIKISGHHPSAFLTAPNHDPPFRTRRHSSLFHQTKSF